MIATERKYGRRAIRRPLRSAMLSSLALVYSLLPHNAMAAPTALMPMPVSMEARSGTLRLTGHFAPVVQGCIGSITAGALERFERDMVTLAGEQPGHATVGLTVKCAAHDPDPISLSARESYRLDVAPDGLTIEADGEVGVLRALATARQLLARDAKGPYLPAAHITDAPRFAWRGLMLDTVRHFMTVATVKRQIDAMELAKLNVLHLHLSDNEGFRVESRLYPKLTADTQGQFYRQSEIVDLVRYAAARGVRIVPEFDLPGHAHAILAAYPELGVGPIDPKDPLLKPKSVLNPASEETYRFLTRLLGELVPLFPDRQFHVGGDEVSDVAWKDSPMVNAFKAAHGLTTKQQLEGYFHHRIRELLAAKGKSTVGWDEMADEPLPANVIVQAWRSANPLQTATAKGHRVILSSGFYINDLQWADYYYGLNMLDPMATQTMTAQDLAKVRRNPVTAAQVSDGLVARQVPPLTPDQEKLVIGGEAAMWAETVTDEMLDGRLWPRSLTVAERFWSPASVKDADDMFERMLPAMDQLRALGLQDENHRQRMIARLAPDQSGPVATLVSMVAPGRIFTAHMDAMISGADPVMVELVDAASTDGSQSRRFKINTTHYLAGDKSLAPLLRSDMLIWAQIAEPFARAAQGRPLLEKAIPTAQDLAALGELGLAALEALSGGKALTPDRIASGQQLLARLDNYDKASRTMSSITAMKQPPAAIIIQPAADVAKLFDAAMRNR